jgi:DNA-binding protein YbaB
MVDDEMRAQLADAMEQLQEQLAGLARSQREWAELTASGSAGNSRVKVVVNANGVIIETTFANDIGELDYPAIAAAVTRAHQNAVTELSRKTAELMRPIGSRIMGGVGLEEMMPGLPDPLDPLSSVIEPPMTPPKALRDDADSSAADRGILRRSW